MQNVPPTFQDLQRESVTHLICHKHKKQGRLTVWSDRMEKHIVVYLISDNIFTAIYWNIIHHWCVIPSFPKLFWNDNPFTIKQPKLKLNIRKRCDIFSTSLFCMYLFNFRCPIHKKSSVIHNQYTGRCMSLYLLLFIYMKNLLLDGKPRIWTSNYINEQQTWRNHTLF